MVTHLRCGRKLTIKPILIFSDVNECEDDTLNNCIKPEENGNCVNLPGSYRCECLPGYPGDGVETCSGETAVKLFCSHPSPRAGPGSVEKCV